MVRLIYLPALALLGLFRASDAVIPSRKSFVPPQLQKQLAVRGGGGPIDATTAAKVTTGIVLVNGALAALAPEANLKTYKCPSDKPINHALMRRLGLCMLNVGTYGYCLLFKKYSRNTMYSLTSLTWIVELLGSLLNGRPGKVGYSEAGDIVSLALASATAYACSNNLDWALSAVKVLVYYTLLGGLSCSITPEIGAKVWGLKNLDSLGSALVGGLGTNLLSTGVAAATIVWDGDIVKAMGYYCVAVLLGNIKGLFVTGEGAAVMPEDGKMMMYFWMLVQAILAASILL